MTALPTGLRAGAMLATLLLCAGEALSDPAPAHIEMEIPHGRLAGQGSYRWFGLKLYDAQLWIGANGFLTGTLATARFALDLRYARSLQGAKIAQASIDEMKKIGLGSTAQHRNWLARMMQLFPDVKDGTHITGIYLPEHGARFYLDGKLLGDVPDAEFAHAFFSIWLDSRTSAKSLREALLTGALSR